MLKSRENGKDRNTVVFFALSGLSYPLISGTVGLNWDLVKDKWYCENRSWLDLLLI